MRTQMLHEEQKPSPHSPGERIELRCPVCAAALGMLAIDRASDLLSYDCSRCTYSMVSRKGIWQALRPERLAHFTRFLDDYQKVRAAEGRGSQKPEFYLTLPYGDITGHNSWQWKIRARTFECLTGEILPSCRSCGTQKPRILDLGAGNGWMSYRLALEGCHPVAADIVTNELDGLGAAVHFERELCPLFPRIRAEMSSLPFADGQFDAVVFNASFHYAEDYHVVLSEALRCLTTGGMVVIADTPWYSSDESGRQMLAERRATFAKRFGTTSESICSLEYLTDRRLRELENDLNIHWEVATPSYGLRWAMRPLVAKLRGRREPSQFRIYAARKAA